MYFSMMLYRKHGGGKKNNKNDLSRASGLKLNGEIEVTKEAKV